MAIGQRLNPELVLQLQHNIAGRLREDQIIRHDDVSLMAAELGLPHSAVQKVWGYMKRGHFAEVTGLDVKVGRYKRKGIATLSSGAEQRRVRRVTRQIDQEWHRSALSAGEMRKARRGQRTERRRAAIQWES